MAVRTAAVATPKTCWLSLFWLSIFRISLSITEPTALAAGLTMDSNIAWFGIVGTRRVS